MGGWLHKDKMSTKGGNFDGQTFTWDSSLTSLRENGEWCQVGEANLHNQYFMNRDATIFYKGKNTYTDKHGVPRRYVAATKVSATKDQREISEEAEKYQWELHLGDSNDGRGDKTDTDKVWIKHSEDYKSEDKIIEPVKVIDTVKIIEPAKVIDTVNIIEPAKPAPVKMIAEVLKLNSDGNSFVFTEWVNGKKPEVAWPEMKNIKFTWNEAINEWASEKNDFYMNEDATKFYKGKATDQRPVVATKLSANQNSGSARRTDEQMKYHWQLHKNGVTDIVNIKPTDRRRLGASPVLCALMDEIAAQY